MLILQFFFSHDLGQLACFIPTKYADKNIHKRASNSQNCLKHARHCNSNEEVKKPAKINKYTYDLEMLP